MSNSEENKYEGRQRLIQLIRQIAQEEVWEAIDAHLDDYEHKEKPPEE
ncbi:hypothetical protein JW988_04675 [Candidatus Bathyarchaeota archaeon]|nr:hypothetical protein [Candidatus Bathyarchaeota archaeon]